MADNQPQYFDVKTLLGSPWTRSVNLMCHLLQRIPYRHLYGDPIEPGTYGTHLFHELLSNAKSIPDQLQYDADGNPYDVRLSLSDAFNDIIAIVDVYNSGKPTEKIKLGEFFWKPRVPSSTSGYDAVKNAIVDRLDRIPDRQSRMRHFCAPFVDVQKYPTITKAPTLPDMENFLRDLGPREMVEFFTKHAKDGAEKAAVKAATLAGILRRQPNAGSTGVLVHDGNGRCCTSGKCGPSPYPDFWCLEVVIDGTTYCALGSDSC